MDRENENPGGTSPSSVRLLGETPREHADAAYRAHHPEPTVLLLMRFGGSAVLRGIDAGVRSAGARFGRDVVRADDRDYTGELWANVALCLHNSDLVVAVLEEIDGRCDANVMVELGFALSSGRRCLILVEHRRPALPTVLRHRLTREFDAYDVPGSVQTQVEDWFRRDLGLVERHDA
ncbi:hypothetical protein Cch01nite_34390 [Cellulomonas chitinilytica]|uniref:Nucleoside 2-deoxyribosyltransferase n=1 Tax=Cellulomonas chitinilytica TaxID=398759 RepID=A0A919U0D1_9CELL|nr:hypothetical protein [Cellulomonas chitinilytica]GIG22715.1 hypothetical protein Cch01nite_34390 [Cellulomonas chitinilytica]